MTLYIGTRGKHQPLDKAKKRNVPQVKPCLPSHCCHCPKQLLSTWTKEKGMDVLTRKCLYSVDMIRLMLFQHFCSLKDSSLSGKKKSEKKARQLLTDLPLPPELPGSTDSTQSPSDDKKSQTIRRRPKYVLDVYSAKSLFVLCCCCCFLCYYYFNVKFNL